MSRPPDLRVLGLAVRLFVVRPSRLVSNFSPTQPRPGFEFNAATEAKLGLGCNVEWPLLGAKMPRKQTPRDGLAMLS